MTEQMTKKRTILELLESEPKLLFAVRIRGSAGMSKKVEDTLKMLRMNKVNHGVLIWGGEKSFIGMLHKCKDFISFGEINKNTLLRLLRVRGRVEGNKPLTEVHIKNLTEYRTMNKFADALLKGEIRYRAKDIPKIKPLFRLHPPRRGHKGSIKKHHTEGGPLGYVGHDYINELIHKMI
ncbi:MAG: 50S ribosomal protein L30 [Promethearchaeota archaeon]|nr:MAG: 50S ribosomal protein L30 [Candidatus Lokiarchaeota archaeon]